MKFKDVKVSDLLWNTKMAGAWFVVMKTDAGAFVINLFLTDNPMNVGLILPRDTDEWVVDDKNHPVTDEERENIKSKMQIWEFLND